MHVNSSFNGTLLDPKYKSIANDTVLALKLLTE